MAGVLNLCFSIFKEFLLSAPFFRGQRRNTVDGEEIYYIPNPALGLWINREKF